MHKHPSYHFLLSETKVRHILSFLSLLASIVWFLSGASAQGLEQGIVINVTSGKSIVVEEWGNLTITALCESIPNASHKTLIRNDAFVVPSLVNCTCHRTQPSCTFTIINVDRSHSGNYSIYVNNTQGEHKSIITRVNVQYAPICIWLQPQQMSVIENERVTFDVSVPVPNPPVSSVQWLYEGSPINSSNPRYSGGTVATPPLTIGPAVRSDAGVYNFTASNIIGGLTQSNCTTNLTVYYGPDLDCVGPQTVTINETDSYTFAIDVTSYPILSRVDWFKGGNLVDRSDTRFVHGNVASPSLTLNNANRNDTGSYSVNVTNDVTRRFVYDCYTNLTVQYRPSCQLLLPPQYDITEGSRITINVTVTSLPSPTFVGWNLNGTAIARNNSHYSGGNVTVPSLTISDIRRNDTGFYSIQVNNVVGGVVDNCRVFVRVLYRPECIILSNTSLWVNEHSSITIHAAIDAVTPPTVVDWKLNNNPVSRTGGRYTGGNTYQNPSLNISGITRGEAGTYTLTASNAVGNVVNESNCNVNVVVQYLDNCPNRIYSACENGSQILNCSVRFLPSLNSVTWRKNGAVLDVSSPRYSGGTVSSPDLTISSVLPSDDDVYSCEVENVVGVAGCQITLNVFTRPNVNVTRRNIMLVEGQTSSIGCSVDMRVKPSPAVVHWFKDGVNLNSPSGRYGDGDLNNPSLRITDIKRQDAGSYTCGAVNGVGDSHSDVITVTVEYPPTVVVKYNNYGFHEGSDTTLWCYVNSYPPVSPSNITWVRDGQFVIPSTSCSDVRPNLRMCKVDTNTAGRYICRARHRLASVGSDIITVNVRDVCPTVVYENVTLDDSTSTSSGCISGRLKVQLKGTSSSGTVCGKTWTSAETGVVCGMMGYKYGAHWMRGGGGGPIHLGDVTCLTGATTLNQCRLSSISNCTHDNDLWLMCCHIRVTSPAAAVLLTTAIPTTPSTPTAGSTCQCRDEVSSLYVVVIVLVIVIVCLIIVIIWLIVAMCCGCCGCLSKYSCGGGTKWGDCRRNNVGEGGYESRSDCPCPCTHKPHCSCKGKKTKGQKRPTQPTNQCPKPIDPILQKPRPDPEPYKVQKRRPDPERKRNASSRSDSEDVYDRLEHKERMPAPHSSSYSHVEGISTHPVDNTHTSKDDNPDLMSPNQDDAPRNSNPLKKDGPGSRGGDRKAKKPWQPPIIDIRLPSVEEDDRPTTGSSDSKEGTIGHNLPADDDVNNAINGVLPTEKKVKKKRNKFKPRKHEALIDASFPDLILRDNREYSPMEDSNA
ncbi:hemicentin-1-like [Haliotis cracherodii]|uniref:hemicentin-1-like n=1 Tax=Haliotis cracherodii TaxID=6455 RepID=UPI0039EA111C